MLYFKGDFFYKPRASLARAAFKRDFLINLKAISFFGSKLRKVKFKGISFKTFFDPRYRPPTPVLRFAYSALNPSIKKANFDEKMFSKDTSNRISTMKKYKKVITEINLKQTQDAQ